MRGRTCCDQLCMGALTAGCCWLLRCLPPLQVTPSSSKMIDPEFAYMGPLAFDPAKIIGELVIPYFASDGHEAAAGAGSRSKQRAWLLEAIVEVWETFSTQ